MQKVTQIAQKFSMPWKAMMSYISVGYSKMISDKGMLFADFILATFLPYSMQFLLWSLIYKGEGHSEILGFDRVQLMFYYAFAIAFGRLNNGYNLVETIANAMTEGTMDTHFLKPMSLPLQKFSQFLGESLLYWVPVVALLVLQAAYSPGQNILFRNPTYVFLIFAVFMLAQCLCFIMSFLLSLLAFWLERGELILSTLSMSAAFFGGTLLPPGHWPDWLRPIMVFNPYRFMISAPAELLSKQDPSLFKEILLGSLLYCFGLGLLTRCVWKNALKKYTSVGG